MELKRSKRSPSPHPSINPVYPHVAVQNLQIGSYDLFELVKRFDSAEAFRVARYAGGGELFSRQDMAIGLVIGGHVLIDEDNAIGDAVLARPLADMDIAGEPSEPGILVREVGRIGRIAPREEAVIDTALPRYPAPFHALCIKRRVGVLARRHGAPGIARADQLHLAGKAARQHKNRREEEELGEPPHTGAQAAFSQACTSGSPATSGPTFSSTAA